MKIPSLTPIPKHQKFKYEPRFYDPIKEDIEQRTERIRRTMGENPNLSSNYSSNIHHAFSRRTSENKQSNITQLVVIMLLVATIFGYIYYGNAVLYLIIPVAVYIFVRKKFFSERNS